MNVESGDKLNARLDKLSGQVSDVAKTVDEVKDLQLDLQAKMGTVSCCFLQQFHNFFSRGVERI